MRSAGGYGRYNSLPQANERIISALSYLTAGMVGFFWIILSHVTGRTLKPYVKFHAFQSIFISLLYYIATLVMGIILGFLKVIPFVGGLVLPLVFYVTQMPIIFGFSILQFAIVCVVLYLVISCLRGTAGELPWVSGNIRGMM